MGISAVSVLKDKGSGDKWYTSLFIHSKTRMNVNLTKSEKLIRWDSEFRIEYYRHIGKFSQRDNGNRFMGCLGGEEEGLRIGSNYWLCPKVVTGVQTG